MRFVCVSVREVVIFKILGDFGCGGAQAEGYVGSGDAFGCDEDVRLHIPVID